MDFGVGLELPQLMTLAAAAFAGAFVQATTGFGFALVAAPIFLAAMNSTAAIQVLVALHIVQSVMVVPRLVGQAPRPLLGALMAGGLVGFPLGLLVFMRLDVNTLKLAVGIMMLAFTGVLLARDAGWLGASETSTPTPDTPWTTRWLPAGVGMASGFLTSVLVMPGPPLILYLLGGAVQKDQSRAISLTFFGFCYVMVTALHAMFGGMTGREWMIALILSPVVFVATHVGTAAARRLSEGWFRVAVFATLILSGSFAVWTSL